MGTVSKGSGGWELLLFVRLYGGGEDSEHPLAATEGNFWQAADSPCQFEFAWTFEGAADRGVFVFDEFEQDVGRYFSWNYPQRGLRVLADAGMQLFWR